MAMSIPHRAEPWTVEDLPDEGRFEIVDGALVVSPMASWRHDTVAHRIALALMRHIDPDLVRVGRGFTLATDTNYRVPDVMVLREGLDLWSGPGADARDAQLAVEVVSPSSVTTDHITKRAQYAAAGIPAYWIVETDPELSITVLGLSPAGDAYGEVGTWAESQTVDVQSPFPVSIAVSELRRA